MIIFGMHGHTVGGYIGCTKFSHFAGRLAHYGKIFIPTGPSSSTCSLKFSMIKLSILIRNFLSYSKTESTPLVGLVGATQPLEYYTI